MGVPGLVATTFKFAHGGIGIGMGVPRVEATAFKFTVGGLGFVGTGMGVPAHPVQTAAAQNNVITIVCSTFLSMFLSSFSLQNIQTAFSRPQMS